MTRNIVLAICLLFGAFGLVFGIYQYNRARSIAADSVAAQLQTLTAITIDSSGDQRSAVQAIELSKQLLNNYVLIAGIRYADMSTLSKNLTITSMRRIQKNSQRSKPTGRQSSNKLVHETISCILSNENDNKCLAKIYKN